MARVDWFVEGVSFGNCNCDYGCPCQFESRPTHGPCHGIEVFRIDKGHFGETRLEGVCAALIYSWPGPIFEGKGSMQAIIDAHANAAQREALIKLLHGEETDEAATHWWVFHAMSETVHPALFKPIRFEADIEARTASVSIPSILTSTGRPIKSPVTGQDHRVRIDIPSGIEFKQAEIGSASAQVKGAISFELIDSYGQFNRLRHSGGGIVH
jgi:hypothetical protein